ncbi:copper transporter [Actinomyces sp. zg-332]|uniref:copper transporter n=1 Tax=Actinomyces sp. zg-332 TaxID=2708340 RepID=UPI00141FA5DC|nr:copper transporter [Actinomyces sp. zg-332]QPK93733.1 copper transporter [Actinomyces sp. zg-332]
MIDFRYHIVSLVSVFLALAVGIVLGAGPLRTPLGDTLSVQVDSIRSDRDATRKQLENSQIDVKNRNAYISAMAEDILPNTLSDVKVAVVALPYAADEDIDLAVENLSKAGAKVVTKAKVKKEWTVAKQRPFRTSLSGQLTQYLKEKPEHDASVDSVFAKALLQILTSKEENNSLLLNLLVDSSHPMLEMSEVSEPADAIVVLGPKNFENQRDVLGKKISISNDDLESLLSFDTDFSKVLVQAPKGGTVFSDAVDDTDFLTKLRAKEKISTVDSVGTVIGSTSLPIALSNAINGTKENYGVQSGSDIVVPKKVKH